MEQMSSTQRLLARIKKLLYICFSALVSIKNGIKRLPYVCFGGRWRGSETELTDWESVRRVFIIAELLAGLSILFFIFWPASLYISGFSIILGFLALCGLALYKYALRSAPEAPEIDEWHEYWKNKTLV